MNILYLSSSSDLTGAETCLLRLVTAIKKEEDHHIAVISYAEGELTRRFEKLGIKNYVVPRVHAKKSYNCKEIVKLIKNIFLLRKIIKKEKPDVIHAFTIGLHRRVFLLRFIGIKTPIVGTIHDDLTKNHFGYKYYNIVYSINHCYNKLITVSNSVTDFCIKAGVKKNKLKRIYNGIPLNFKSKENNSEKKYFTIGSFGRIVDYKGQHILIDAVKLLKEDIPDIRCYVIGKPPSETKEMIAYQSMLHERVKKYNLEGNVIFVDWTNEIEKYYNMLDIYLLPSIFPDPFPTVNLEAMLYRKPVIAVNIGGSKEQVIDGETGFIIEPNKPEILAEKILYLYENPEIAKKMGEAGYKRVTTKFTMEKYVNEHLNLYSRYVKSNRK
jgi:glycosyltransferase involved in cell wall biosynthesis